MTPAARGMPEAPNGAGISDSRTSHHVLFPFTSNVVGGSFVSSAILIDRLSVLPDWRVSVALPHEGPNTPRFEATSARVRHLGVSEERLEASRRKKFRYRLGMYAHLHYRALSHLRSVRPDLVHVNDDTTMLCWGTAARRLGIPVVWHVRQERRNRLDPLFERVAKKIVFIAESTRSRLPGVEAPKGVVIHNASDTSRFRPAEDRRRAKLELGLRPDVVTIGYAGRLVPVKRPEWAVRAGIDLVRRGVDVQMVVVGPDHTDGRYARELPSMVREHGLDEDAVRVLGFRDDMPEILRALDILVLPSVAEPFGLVVTEAMASGAAVVATDAGGVREILRHGETGLLTAADDYDAFVDAVARLATDHAMRARFATAGRADVRRRFAPERVADEVTAAYRSVL